MGALWVPIGRGCTLCEIWVPIEITQGSSKFDRRPNRAQKYKYFDSRPNLAQKAPAEGVGGGKPPPIRGLLTLTRRVGGFCVEFGSLWAHFGLPLAHFGLPLAHFWLPLAPFWLTFGSLWLTFGALGLTFAHPGARFSHFWALLASFFIFLSIFDEILRKILLSENVH